VDFLTLISCVMKIITVSFQMEETLLSSMIYHIFYALKFFIFFYFKLVFF
jgi:hypothetical protein